ncbi:thiosulfate sulfurtransferase/rhodanese-like domain-containing protein 2 [Alosa pseudoharengus]|uniref:thiosulfate sulfurtransferase/rhodanese-like domain-containing protein 2 n=1 Tax=Alosa pseudoharengus TaxID=34774 RepID=UPI003F8A53B5
MDTDFATDHLLLSLDVEKLAADAVMHDKPDITAPRRAYTHTKKRAFAEFVECRRNGPLSWRCCGQTFIEPAVVHKHVARAHSVEIERRTSEALDRQLNLEKSGIAAEHQTEEEPEDMNAWMPDISHIPAEQLMEGDGEVLLYYCYCELTHPEPVCVWQRELCQMLHLTGKVRVATEGINGTVGGSLLGTRLYIRAMMSHPAFKHMSDDDFKRSEGGAHCFPELRVGVYREIVPMGVDPNVISHTLAGTHLDPEEFHREVQTLLTDEEAARDTVLLDCRNFYESRIGQFSSCLAPDIRKFSYFPDYVDQNLDLFRNKRVLMYCTGGIRCERGSAYLRSKDVCKEVLQLQGGIHKYLERFPDGFYRGKLFVFDERYALAFNDDVISVCRYCGVPWDQYALCWPPVCCQLVLSCGSCRERGHTACCPTCQRKREARTNTSHTHSPDATHSTHSPDTTHTHREECECTDTRPRIPKDS